MRKHGIGALAGLLLLLWGAAPADADVEPEHAKRGARHTGQAGLVFVGAGLLLHWKRTWRGGP